MSIGALAWKLVADTRKFTEGLTVSRRELAATKQILEEVRTPHERYGDQLDSLQQLLNKNVISVEDYTRAAQKLKAELPENVAAQERLNQQLQAADRIRKGLVTQEQKLIASAREATDLKKAGLLTEDEYRKRLEQIRSQMPAVIAAEKRRADSLVAAERTAAAAVAEAERRMADEARKRADVMERGARVTQSMLTPTEQFAAEVAELNGLLRAGAITQETHSRAMATARGKMFGTTAELQKQSTAMDDLRDRYGSNIPVIGRFLGDFGRIHPVAIGAAAGLAGVTAALGIAATAWRIASHAVATQIERLDGVAKSAHVLGMTVGEYQRLQYATANIAGITSDQFDTAMQQMSRRLSEAAMGAGEARESLQKLGLDASTLATASPAEAFKQIADAIGSVQAPADQLRITFDLFGRGSAALVTALREGRTEIEQLEERFNKLGGAISEIDATQIESASDSLEDLLIAVQGLAVQLTTLVAPALTQVINDLTGAIAEPGKAIEGATKSMFSLRSVTALMSGDIEAVVTGGYTDYWASVRDRAGEASLELINAQQSIEEQRKAAQQQAELEEQERSLAKAKDDATAIIDRNKTAQEKYNEGIATATDLLRSGALSEEQYSREAARLQRELTAAAGPLADLQRQLATFGMSDKELKLFDMASGGATEKELAQASAMMDRLAGLRKAEEDHNRMMDQGRAITERYASPMDQFKKKIADLTRLYRAGAIDLKTFERAQQEETKTALDAMRAKEQLAGANTAVLQGSAEAVKMEQERKRELMAQQSAGIQEMQLEHVARTTIANTPAPPAPRPERQKELSYLEIIARATQAMAQNNRPQQEPAEVDF